MAASDSVLRRRHGARRPRCRPRAARVSFISRTILRHWPSAGAWLIHGLYPKVSRPSRPSVDAGCEEMLADDVKPRFRQQVMDVGDAAVQRILYRDKQDRSRQIADRGNRILECGRRNGSSAAAPRARRDWRRRPVRPGRRRVLALLDQVSFMCPNSASRNALARSSGVSTAERHAVHARNLDPHPRFQRAQLLQLLAFSSGEAGSETKRSSASRVKA